MKHIDKTLYKEKGEQIVSEFLICFHNRKGTYPNDMYNAFSKEIDDAHNHVSYRKRLIDEVLCKEQKGRCCYCMRTLSKCDKPNIEHIMPNHAKDKAELDTYRIQPTELDGLPHPDDFKQQPFSANPPHPHSIAYQNLAMSCDGDLFNENATPACCNLRRKHKFMPPIILYSNIQTKFEYCEDGTAAWINDPEPPESKQNVVRLLGLNNGVLKMIRRIWFFCKDNHIILQEEKCDEIINIMYGHFASQKISERDTNMLMNFKKEKYWKLLLQYDAFAEITHTSKKYVQFFEK